MVNIHKKRCYTIAFLCSITFLLLVLVLNIPQLLILNIIRSHNINIINKQSDNIVKDIDMLGAVREITLCRERPRLRTIVEVGDFIVLYNLVLAERDFLCHESVTFASQGDYSFVDNVVPLVERWQGPLSVALYAPGDDFKPTLDSIAYVRSCEFEMVRELVSFHVYYERNHPPKMELEVGLVPYIESYNWTWDCSIKPPFETINPKQMYRTEQKMDFFINVGRNIAIRESQTHFLLSADLELYPSVNIIPKFFEMLIRDHEILETFPKKVYVLPVFESAKEFPSPQTKSELQDLFKIGKALVFSEKFCPDCHNMPRKKEWLTAEDNGSLAVFSNTSRRGKYKRWEPVYIGTHAEPMFQERVTWDGGSDKMVKDFVLCLLDYKLLALDNAFIVHKPGFKKAGAQKQQTKRKMTKIILEQIVPELETVYGKRKGCVIGGQFSKNLPKY